MTGQLAMRISTSATAAVLAALSDDEEDALDTTSESAVDHSASPTSSPYSVLGAGESSMSSKDGDSQYALFPLPRLQSHLRMATRSSTPVSPAFSPHEPPRIPLPKLPDAPSPILFSSSNHSRYDSDVISGLAGQTQFPNRTAISRQDCDEHTRSPRSRDVTLSPLTYTTATRFSSRRRERDATIKPFEEKLSQSPSSPMQFHEFQNIVFDETEINQVRINTSRLSLEPPLPIQPPLIPSLRPKSPSVTSLKYFDEMVLIALEATASNSSSRLTSQDDIHTELQAGSTSREGSIQWSEECHSASDSLPYEDDDLWTMQQQGSRRSNINSLPSLRSGDPRPPTLRKNSRIVFNDCSSSDEEAFDLSLDVNMSCHMSDSEFNGDSSELEVADGQKGQQDEMLSDYMGGQQDSIHLCDDSSATSSISGWTDRRDSLATTTSQTSSNDTSTACRSPAVSVSGGLNSTLKKQDLETLNEEFGESMRIPDCNAGDKSPLVSSTPCATSLVKIRSPRSSPLHAQIRKEEASSQAAVHEDSRSIVPQPTLTQHIASRSRMPTFGFTGIRRRPSETPAYGSLDGELSPSMVDRSPVSSNGSLNKKTFSPPYPSGSSSSSSFASLTVNKIRNVRSTPLLRRKGSSQLRLLSANSILEQGGDCKEAYVADLEGASKVRGDNPSLSTLKPPFMGVRKGSLPEVLKRYEGTASTVQRRASFLPTSLRRKS